MGKSSVDAAIDTKRLHKGLQKIRGGWEGLLVCCHNAVVLMCFSRLEQDKVAFQFFLFTENTCSFIFLQNKATIQRQAQLI